MTGKAKAPTWAFARRPACSRRPSGRLSPAVHNSQFTIHHAGAFRSAFTLIELLIVSAILGVIVFVIGACIAAGVRVWDAARVFNDADSQALFGLAVMEKDVSSAFPFGPIPFKGDVEKISFVGLKTGKDADPFAVTTVQYSFDVRRRSLARREWPYPDGNEGQADEEELVTGVSGVRLTYFKPPSEDREGVWQESWTDSTGFPSRVEMELILKTKGAESTYKRLFFIPCSGAP